MIAECLGHLECVLYDQKTWGDHTLFVGEVVGARAEEDFFRDRWLAEKEDFGTVHHLGADYYTFSTGKKEVRIHG